MKRGILGSGARKMSSGLLDLSERGRDPPNTVPKGPPGGRDPQDTDTWAWSQALPSSTCTFEQVAASLGLGCSLFKMTDDSSCVTGSARTK